MTFKVSDAQYSELEAWVHHYIDTKCIVRDTKMPGKQQGSEYTWMFYLRRGLFNQEFLINVGRMFIYHMERIDPKFNFQITGLETAATPMLASIPIVAKAMEVDINAFVVRKTRKEYGLLNIIEGLPNDKLAVMVDDLCNSSRSMAQCLKVLHAENIPVANVAFAIVNKSNKEVHDKDRLNGDMYLPKNLTVISLFDLDDFDLSNPSH
jgi:orotate phosphoribosyltransferase